MNKLTLTATMMAAGLLMAATSFAQTSGVKKQPTQEGAPAISEPCARPFNANPAGDPDCKQHTQNLTPTSAQPPTASK